MLSNQMLSGIPEVDLGIELVISMQTGRNRHLLIIHICRSKFRNIEETEIAKRKVFEESRSKKTDGTTMLPTNMAADFVHHNRCEHNFEPKQQTRMLRLISFIFSFSGQTRQYWVCKES